MRWTCSGGITGPVFAMETMALSPSTRAEISTQPPGHVVAHGAGVLRERRLPAAFGGSRKTAVLPLLRPGTRGRPRSGLPVPCQARYLR